MGKCTLDGEEFDPESSGQTCPNCLRKLWPVELKTHLIPTPLLEKLLAGVDFLKTCLACRPARFTN